ncbi:hypothetical protein Lal_00018488 [Lupinus albus]|nr:hypothetical protein Lal_00018488 [Lupinus albus]
MSDITLRSGKHTELPTYTPDSVLEKTHSCNYTFLKCCTTTTSHPSSISPNIIPSKKMEEVDKEILDTFRKLEVNIPLLDVIKLIPRYAKFLKEFCTQKRELKADHDWLASFGSSDVASFGSNDVASFGSSDVANFGSSYVASFGSIDIASFGSSDVANFGSSYVASFGSSVVANFGSSSMVGNRNGGIFSPEREWARLSENPTTAL